MTAMGIRTEGGRSRLKSNVAYQKARPKAGFFIMGHKGSFKETD